MLELEEIISNSVNRWSPIAYENQRETQIANELAKQILYNLKAYGYRVVKDDPDHIVEFSEVGWTMKHSLECRISGDLFKCPTAKALQYTMELGLVNKGDELSYLPLVGDGKYEIWIESDGMANLAKI